MTAGYRSCVCRSSLPLPAARRSVSNSLPAKAGFPNLSRRHQNMRMVVPDITMSLANGLQNRRLRHSGLPDPEQRRAARSPFAESSKCSSAISNSRATRASCAFRNLADSQFRVIHSPAGRQCLAAARSHYAPHLLLGEAEVRVIAMIDEKNCATIVADATALRPDEREDRFGAEMINRQTKSPIRKRGDQRSKALASRKCVLSVYQVATPATSNGHFDAQVVVAKWQLLVFE